MAASGSPGPVARRVVVSSRGRSSRSKPDASPATPPLPRITRLLALAIYFDDLIRRGEAKDFAELARIGRVSRARLTQIMDLLNLAPDELDRLLCKGSRGVSERSLRPALRSDEWRA